MVAAPSTERFVIDGESLAHVDRLLRAFEQEARTGGDRDRMDAAVTAIARAGSRPDDPACARSEQDFMVRLMRCASNNDERAPVRVWFWLAAVVEAAAERGDHRLATRCVGFTTWWLLVQTPQMSPAAEMAMRLCGACRTRRVVASSPWACA